jgi:hypothetical protein
MLNQQQLSSTTPRSNVILDGRFEQRDYNIVCPTFAGVAAITANTDTDFVCGIPGWSVDADTDYVFQRTSLILNGPATHPRRWGGYANAAFATPVSGDSGALRSGLATSATSSPKVRVTVALESATSSLYTFRTGLTNQAVGTSYDTAVTRGCYIEASSTALSTWYGFCNNGSGVSTGVNLNVATSTLINGTTTPQTLEVEMSPTVAIFIIDGVERGRITTNIPSSDIYPISSLGITGAAAGTSRDLYYFDAAYWADNPND